MAWEHFGYQSNTPCEICGKTEDTRMEPRFSYVVCEEHSKLSPIEVSNHNERRDAGLQE